MISVQNISKSFGLSRAVDNLSFIIKPGEIVGLLGPNGAGKSTTMRIMSGFLSPDSGTVEVEGINVLENPVKAQEIIGYLPENNPLYKDMLVSELLKYSAALKNIGQDKFGASVDFAVSNVSIEDVYYRPISELSKGFKQRVGIAVALLNKPKILIMDEPSEGLDPNQRTEIRTLIRQLSKNHTIIMSTHVMQEVEAVCSRMIIINRGKLVADGTPKQLIRQAGGSHSLTIDIEGRHIEKKLQALDGIDRIEFPKTRDNHFSATLFLKKGRFIQPDISRLASKEGWVIWKLSEEEKQLEDVFHLLTK